MSYAALSRLMKLPQATVRDFCLQFESSGVVYVTVEDLRNFVEALPLKRACNHAKYKLEPEHLQFLTS